MCVLGGGREWGSVGSPIIIVDSVFSHVFFSILLGVMGCGAAATTGLGFATLVCYQPTELIF